MNTAETLQIKVQDETKGNSNYVTRNLLECMKFWNNTGIAELQIAREEEPDKHTKQFDDEVLNKMLIDCKTFCNSGVAKGESFRRIYGEAECGRTRSHVWVHLNGERVLMFHV